MKVYLYDVFHRCESLTDWEAVDCTLSLSSTQKIEGKYSIKIASNDFAFGLMRYYRTVDWSEFQAIIFSVYHPGWTDETGLIVLYTDELNWKGWEFDFAADWTEITIDLSSAGVNSAGTLDLSNITLIEVLEDQLENPGEDYYFDFFRGRSIDVTDSITDLKITEEMGQPSWADLKIKGESLDHFNAGLEMEVYDKDDVLSWTGRILYPESVMVGKDKVVGELKAIGSNSQFNNTYRKNYTTARDSDYVIKDVIDNALGKFSYDDEIDNFTRNYKYDMKNKIQKLFNYLSMLERAVIGYKPDGEMFFNKYDNLTASGLSWNQNTSHVRITSYTPNANRYVTRAPVIGANNDLGQVYYVGKATVAEEQKYGINYLQTWRDSEITNYSEAKQIGDNLQIIYSIDTQMISIFTVGKGHVQVAYTIEIEWTGVFNITKKDFLVTKRVWYPIIDLSEIDLTDNILTRKAFNVRVINKFYDEDAQQAYEESDVPESTEDGVVQPLVSISELRVAGVGGAHTLASHTSKHHQELTDYNEEANVKHLTAAQVAQLHDDAITTNAHADARIALANHDILQNPNGNADEQHLTAAQVAALHAKQHAMDNATYHTSSDIATLNSSTTKHGFLKKLDNNALKFMNGQGNWAEPAGVGGISEADVFAYLAIGEANALELPMALMGGNRHAEYIVSANEVKNVDSNDFSLEYNLPAYPTNRYGKKLYIKNIYVGVSDADNDDFVSRIAVYAWTDHDTRVEVDSIGDDIKAPARVDYSTKGEWSGPYDMSSYIAFGVHLSVVAETASEFGLSYINIEIYYDT